MRLPEMTTRRWMIAVAVVAVGLGVAAWCTRLPDDEREVVVMLLAMGELWIFVRVIASVPSSKRIPKRAEPRP
jgi:hypothetical protein